MGFLNGRHPAWIKTLPICGVLSKQSFYKLFIAGTATEANRDILFINCAPLIARSHQLPIHMDIKPRVLNLFRLISFNSIQQREGEARHGVTLLPFYALPRRLDHQNLFPGKKSCSTSWSCPGQRFAQSEMKELQICCVSPRSSEKPA